VVNVTHALHKGGPQRMIIDLCHEPALIEDVEHNLTRRPASSSLPPKYPPIAPAPTTRSQTQVLIWQAVGARDP
jgi:hypothetical protein